jgi:hypothetical protein
MIILGVLSMVGAWFADSDPSHIRFWSNFLHNSVFFTGIAFIALFFYSANVIALAGWHTQIKRIWESYYMFLLPGMVLMLIIALGVWQGYHHLYHWADAESVANDPILEGKSPFLNTGWYFLATLGFVGVWFLIGMQLRRLSLKEDKVGTMQYKQHKKQRIWAALFLPLGGFTSAAAVWLWLMSVDAHWYSTLFAWYCGASWLVAMLSLTIITVIFLKNKGYLPNVTKEHLHDLGKYLFAFSIFWTYLWFSQYMLIWYANVGEETVYFKQRIDDYPVLFYGNVLINFVLPFFVLMRNDTKRKYGTLVFASAAVFFGHWLDFFLMVKPGTLHTAHELAGHHHHGEAAHHAAEAAGHAAEHASTFTAGFTLPGFYEIGTMVGFLGLFLYFAFSGMSKAKLVPPKDPYLEESYHHHV